MKNYSTEFIRYKIPENKHDHFERSNDEAGKFLKQSDYCLNYQVLHGEEEPDNYIVIIHRTSKEDHLDGFRNSREFKGFFELVSSFYTYIQEMKHYNLTAITWQKQITS
jgi:heme-degrading monooxygenase HmoA